jgi:hypothetical protein
MNTISLKILASLITLFGLGAGSGYVVAKRTSPAPPAPLVRVATIPLGIRTNLPNRFFTHCVILRVRTSHWFAGQNHPP